MSQPILQGWKPHGIVAAGALLYVGWSVAAFVCGVLLKFGGPAFTAALASAGTPAP